MAQHKIVSPQSSQSDSTVYLMALSCLKGFGPRTLLRLLSAAGGDPLALWEANDGFLKTHLSKTEKQQFIDSRAALSFLNPDVLLSPYLEKGITMLSILDPQYPEALRSIYDPPLLLYVRGNAACLAHPQLAVVGTRKITPYGRQATQQLLSQLAATLQKNALPPMVITSGLAEGVDGQAHQTALDSNLPTIAVFGCGIDKIFPSFHHNLANEILATGGALVSEYPLGVSGSRYTFPQRNRIVAGMSQGVLIVEGSAKSGSFITARLALEENRTVMAVPGNIFEPAAACPNRLIQQGAFPILKGLDILTALGIILPESTEQNEIPPSVYNPIHNKEALALERVSDKPLRNIKDLPAYNADIVSPESKAVLDQLNGDTNQGLGMLVDHLAMQLGWSVSKLNTQLTLMELDGWVELLPGSRVVKAGNLS